MPQRASWYLPEPSVVEGRELELVPPLDRPYTAIERLLAEVNDLDLRTIAEMTGDTPETIHFPDPTANIEPIPAVSVPPGGNLIVTQEQYCILRIANLLPNASRDRPARLMGQSWVMIAGANEL